MNQHDLAAGLEWLAEIPFAEPPTTAWLARLTTAMADLRPTRDEWVGACQHFNRAGKPPTTLQLAERVKAERLARAAEERETEWGDMRRARVAAGEGLEPRAFVADFEAMLRREGVRL